MLNGAAYEWEHHAPILQDEGKLTEEVLEEVKKRKAWQGWEDDADCVLPLNQKQRAVLAYTDAVTVAVSVSEEIFAKLKKCFLEREIVEITATVAAYNCVSRFLVALDVGEMSEAKAKS